MKSVDRKEKQLTHTQRQNETKHERKKINKFASTRKVFMGAHSRWYVSFESMKKATECARVNTQYQRMVFNVFSPIHRCSYQSDDEAADLRSSKYLKTMNQWIRIQIQLQRK